jgi:WD40 repeat protein
MRHLLLSLLSLLAIVHTGQAQCNPKEYTRIFQEATTFQQKGEFIEAKNRYEAAKIYACNQHEKDAADGKVDALFEQINRLREQADSTALSAYANELAYKSKTVLRDRDRNKDFRIAEFANRYIEANNPNVLQTLIDALYYDDHPGQSPLPRVSIFQGYTDWQVQSVAYSSDGQRLATGSYDKTSKIWDSKSGNVLITLHGHTAPVTSVAFSPDGKWLATGSDDKTAKVWYLKSGKTLLTCKGHTKGIVSVVFSPDGQRLLTGSHDITAIIWNAENGKILMNLTGHLKGVKSVVFSPHSNILATGSSDKTAKIWDSKSGKLLMNIEGHISSVISVAFPPMAKDSPQSLTTKPQKSGT